MARLKTALLVIDMQRIFAPMTTDALPNIQELIKHFQSSATEDAKPIIIFTQHGHTQEELTAKPSPNQLVRKWGPEGSIARGCKNWEFQDEIQQYVMGARMKNGRSPRIVHKNTYDAFINTDLSSILGDEGIERVIVCGVMTDCCW